MECIGKDVGNDQGGGGDVTSLFDSQGGNLPGRPGPERGPPGSWPPGSPVWPPGDRTDTDHLPGRILRNRMRSTARTWSPA